MVILRSSICAPRKGKSMSIITVGIDLAKNVFAAHGVDDNGKAARVKPKISREHLLPLIAQLPPCFIRMEACTGAHYWARQFPRIRPRRQARRPEVRHALSHVGKARQERCCRCRCDLRSRQAVPHALRPTSYNGQHRIRILFQGHISFFLPHRPTLSTGTPKGSRV